MKRQPPGPFMTLWGPLLAGTVLLGVTACGKEVPAAPLVCEEPKTPEVSSLWQCGPTLDFTPINSYQGEFADVVQDKEDAVVLIDGRCTGTLIEASAGPVVVTAGHCVGVGDRALLVFNFEDEADGDPLITEGTVIEQSLEPDYALIQLDVLPAITPVLLSTRASERLAIIQHPRGRPKVIAEGSFLDSCNQLVYYTDLDTLVGSSGAGVLNRQGHLMGIHTDGDCDEDGRGANRGWTVEAIVEASPYLQSADIVER
ncbi:trypsin-like peptidase domain-containing protein [Archangium minus]|uniref:Trypsin-like peptidase domain-containing protein n=1 Tax=Archangium minus TaxID=83450 RepID=A0ABY9WNJ6_9BACT|nr:trypsin-like peptidase domain-containing protein [Archangium violaceum]WNG45359.1 trypsin-like peptidase domain-containing protein [Archangium minus]